MAAGLKTIKIKFSGDTTDLDKASKRASGDVSEAVGKISKAGGLVSKAFNFGVLANAASVATGAIGSVGHAIGGLISDAQESAKVARVTANVIKTTGGAAKVTADHVGDLATAISNKTGADDEAVQSGQNLLLTFTNIKNGVGAGNDIFDQASQTIVDMAAAMNNGEVSASGLKSSSVQLGKALNDPIKGITALSKVGVSFTDQQKEQIKALVKNGDTMGAQKIILRELNKEFGGTAAAATTPAQKATVAWGNFREQLGGYLLPVVNKLFSYLNSNLIPAMSRLGDVIATRVMPWLKANLVPVLERVGAWVRTDGVPLFQAFVAQLRDRFTPVVKALWAFVKDHLVPFLQKIGQAVADNRDKFLKLYNAISPLTNLLIKTVLPIVVKLAGKLLDVLGPAIGKAVDLVGYLAEGLADVINFGRKLAGILAGAFRAIRSAWDSSGMGAVVDGLGKAAGLVSKVGGAVGGALGHIPGLATGGVVTSGMTLVGERGPELLLNAQGRTVVPNGQLNAALGGAGGDTTVVINATGPTLQDIVSVEIKKANRAVKQAVTAGSRRLATS